MSPTSLYEAERRTGVARKVIAEYAERRWVPDPAAVGADALELCVRAVRVLREELTPRELDRVYAGLREGGGQTMGTDVVRVWGREVGLEQGADAWQCRAAIVALAKQAGVYREPADEAEAAARRQMERKMAAHDADPAEAQWTARERELARLKAGGPVVEPESALRELNERADALMAKDAKFTLAAAQSAVLRGDPALYARVTKEQLKRAAPPAAEVTEAAAPSPARERLNQEAQKLLAAGRAESLGKAMALALRSDPVLREAVTREQIAASRKGRRDAD